MFHFMNISVDLHRQAFTWKRKGRATNATALQIFWNFDFEWVS